MNYYSFPAMVLVKKKGNTLDLHCCINTSQNRARKNASKRDQNILFSKTETKKKRNKNILIFVQYITFMVFTLPFLFQIFKKSYDFGFEYFRIQKIRNSEMPSLVEICEFISSRLNLSSNWQ